MVIQNQLNSYIRTAVGVHIGQWGRGTLGVERAQLSAIFLLPLDILSGDDGSCSFQGEVLQVKFVG